MTHEEKKQLEARAKVLKAMSHPTRLWILNRLAEGERCVCELVDGVDADFSTVSRHLSVLREAGIVSDERRGKQVIYSLLVPCVLQFMTCIEAVLSGNEREGGPLEPDALRSCRLTSAGPLGKR